MPTERHEHYDPDGNLTGYTVVVRESEWDDTQRDRLLALAEYEAGVCDCGLHESITSDPSNLLTFEDKFCPVCKASAAHFRKQQAADEKAMKPHGDSPAPGIPRPEDGRRTFLRPLTPDEVEKVQASGQVPEKAKRLGRQK